MSSFSLRKKDPVFYTGLVAILLSFAFFVFRSFSSTSIPLGFNGMFGINFAIAVLYFCLLLGSKRLKEGANGFFPFLLFLVLFLISAYSLNREMKVFEISTSWFCVVLILVCGNYIALGLFTGMPDRVRYVLFAIAGVAICVFVYLGVYLFPLYLFSTVASPFLGISLHTFVPLLFCIFTVKLIRTYGEARHRKAFFAAAAACLLFVTGYVLYWNRNLKEINQYYGVTSFTENDRLPGWVNVAQHARPDAISGKILKTDLVYAVPDETMNFFWETPKANFDARVHDPLVIISSFFCGRIYMPEEDRIKVLETLYDSRHQAQERLWSGEDIRTEHVSTNVQVWPAVRTSFTEMNLTITHVPSNDRWASREEAIYTFHLPEGGVCTSLSLWIDGHEEKGILTSKEKAAVAYTTIVGKERRDPSVVHWQEGNTVTVRIFPVQTGETRKFKIGITAPLRFENARLNYDNIYFDGPSVRGTEEDITLTSRDSLANWKVPAGFTREAGVAEREGTYAPAWSCSLDAPPLSTAHFQFNGCAYTVQPIAKEIEAFSPNVIFLDINAAWTEDETERIYQLTKDRKLYVSTGSDELEEVTAANRRKLFRELRKDQFSLFPFHKIAVPEQSLLITHSGSVSPTIAEIRNSEFLKKEGTYFQRGATIRVFDLGTERSPYLKSLKEFRVLQVNRGTEKQLQQQLHSNTFEKTIETDNIVALEPAGLSLKRSTDSTEGHAPDHLMRLFAYNHILAQSGRHLLAGEEETANVVAEAQEAYVVSPSSSLIVLESQKDYDRFDIKDSKNSLQNATLKSKGSVPEPGEWALACLSLLACLVFGYRRSYRYVPFNRSL